MAGSADPLLIGRLSPEGGPETAALSDFVALERAPGSTSSTPGAVVRCCSMTIRGERRKGEVLITVDGSPLDWRSSLAVRNHSPTGTGVGLRQLGSGPARAGHPAERRGGGRAIPPAEWSVIGPIEADRWALDACCRPSGSAVRLWRLTQSASRRSIRSRRAVMNVTMCAVGSAVPWASGSWSSATTAPS